MSSDQSEKVAEAVDGPLMMQHMELFNRYWKHAGSAEELESLKYCEAEMAKAGFATKIIFHDALISLPGNASAVVDGEKVRAITHSFSQSSPPGGLTAPLVYVGGGGEADFAGKDVAGKIVVVDGIASPAVSQRASRAGALGQLHISPHEHLHEMCVSPVWGSPTVETRHNLPTTVIVSIPLEEGTEIKRTLAERGVLRATLEADVDTAWRETPILVADMAGPSGASDEPFVFYTGHHDTWYYGVMDNGGANATMIEVSRIAAAHRDAWQRGLRVVFWSGHSQGRYSSSSWYADAFHEEIDARALVHVNVDSTGGMGNTVVADTTAIAELRGLAAEAIKLHSGQTFTNRRQSRAGDQSFWGIGVPGIFQNMSEQPATGEQNASAAVFGSGARLGHGTGWWWHNPADTLDKIDEAILVRDTKIYMHAVWRLLTDPVLPLDYAEHARYLAGVLDGLVAAAGDRFDLSVLTERTAALEALATRLNEAAKGATGDKAARINAALKAVSRALVPADHTLADRFQQDPALPIGSYACLEPIARFAEVDPASDEGKFLTVTAMRGRNRVAVALANALAALTACLEDIGAAAQDPAA